MVLLGDEGLVKLESDMGRVESRICLFGDNINVSAR
jgi:hypothetical protein